MPLLFAPRTKLLFIGDSVTDCDRKRPVGEGLFGATGKGYVTLVDAMLCARHPELGLRVVNMGIGGQQARHLVERWKADVLDHKPDYVAVMIGINDVWRQFDCPRQTEEHHLPKDYARCLDAMCRRTKVKRLILMTPYFIEANRGDAMRRRMDEYGALVKQAARRHKALCIDTQAAFDRVLEQRERWMEPQARREGDAEWLFLRFYDFNSDETLTLNLVMLKREGASGWRTRSMRPPPRWRSCIRNFDSAATCASPTPPFSTPKRRGWARASMRSWWGSEHLNGGKAHCTALTVPLAVRVCARRPRILSFANSSCDILGKKQRCLQPWLNCSRQNSGW